MLTLPNNIQVACAPLFDKVPIENAMGQLIGSNPKHVDLVETILRDPALKDRSDLAAGLWLYVDDLEQSHTVSQSIDGATGAYWHSIMHRREGDFLQQSLLDAAGGFPRAQSITLRSGPRQSD